MRFIILALIISSCGPTFYLKRAERDLKRAEQLGAKIKTDTVWIDKIVYVHEYKTDTLFKQVDFRDTVTLETTKVLTKVKVNTVTKEVYIKSVCKSDTVKIKVPVTIIKKIKAGHSNWDMGILAIVVLLVGAVLSRIFWK